MSKNYYEIFREHKHFLCDKHIPYLFIYDRIFNEILIKNRPIKMLEIGVCNGGSLEIWKKYLPSGSEIHGVDINPNCAKLQFEENIHFHLGNATDKAFILDKFKDIEFDIILDDGSHKCKDVIKTFEILFPKLAWGGIYIVEDMQTSYWKQYGGGFLKNGSSIEYFKNLLDALNYDKILYDDYSNEKQGVISKIIKNYINKTVLKKTKKHMDLIRKYQDQISQISFFYQMALIQKFHSKKIEPFTELAVKAGNISEVAPAKSDIEINQEIINTVKRRYTERTE